MRVRQRVSLSPASCVFSLSHLSLLRMSHKFTQLSLKNKQNRKIKDI